MNIETLARYYYFRPRPRPGRYGQIIVFVAMFYFVISFSQAAPTSQKLKQGVFLVATDRLTGSSFEQTVILITKYNRYGAYGVAINRPSEFTVHNTFPSVKSNKQNDPVFLGGPVQTTAFIYLITKSDAKNTLPVIDGVYLGGGQKNLIPLLENLPPNENIRTYAGYSGWAPGQLEAELARGDWFVTKADKASIFEENSNLWDRLTQILTGKWI